MTNQRTCTHPYMAFGSGDYYIFCHTCGARWGHLSNAPGPDVIDSFDCNTSLSGQVIRSPVEPTTEGACPFCGTLERYTNSTGNCCGCGAPEDLANERNNILLPPWDAVAQLIRNAKARRALKSTAPRSRLEEWNAEVDAAKASGGEMPNDPL